MKTGRPGYYIPAATTVSRDAKLVFTQTRERLAELLNVELGLCNLSLEFSLTHVVVAESSVG